MDLSTKYTMKPSEKMKQYNEKNAHYSQENTMKIEKMYFSLVILMVGGYLLDIIQQKNM